MKRSLTLALSIAVLLASPTGLAQEKPAAQKPPTATAPKDAPPPKPADAPEPAPKAEPKPDEGTSLDAMKRPAQAGYAVEILVLHATNSDRGIDPRIGAMPELKRAPFSSYKSYELVIKSRMSLIKGKPQRLRLPNGRVLQMSLLQVLPKDKLRLSASINQPNGKDFLPVLEVKAKRGEAFMVAGQSYKKGILVLVIRVAK
jgi:hypothetical protein